MVMEQELAVLRPGDSNLKLREKERLHAMAQHRPKAPDGGWGWMVVIGSFLANFCVEGLCRSMGMVYVAMLEKYNDTATNTSLVTSSYNTLCLALGPLADIASGRVGCKAVVIAGSILTCLGHVLAGLSSTLWQIILAYGVLGGVATGFILTPSYIMVGQYFDKKRGIAMSISTVGCGVGGIAMAPLVAYLLEEFALYGTFLIMGSLMLNCAVSGMLFRPLVSPCPKDIGKQTDNSDSLLPQETKSGAIEEGKTHSGTRSPFSTWLLLRFSMLKDLTFLLYCMNMMAICFGVQSVFTFMPALALEKGFTHRDAAVLLSVAGFTDIAGRFVNGVLFDLKSVRYRRRPVHSIIGIASGCTVIAIGYAPSFYTLVGAIILWGIAEGGFHGQRITIIPEFVNEKQQSSAIGICIFFQGMGNLLSPVTGAMVQRLFGTYVISMYYFGVVVIISSGLFLLDYFWKKKQKGSVKTFEDIVISA